MKKTILISMLGTLFLANIAHADLNLIGQGTSAHGTYNLIYDTDFDVTWYDYTNSSANWDDQMAWAGDLSVDFGGNTYDDWRMPTTVDGTYVWGYDGTTTVGYNITTSEMGHLFYAELGNSGHSDTSGDTPGCGNSSPYCLTNPGDFQNLQAIHYWSSTEYSNNPEAAWHFDTRWGYQGTNVKDLESHYAIAVRPGLAVVPEPISSSLFIVGSVFLGIRNCLRRRNRR